MKQITIEEQPAPLEPLPKFSVGIPDGWKEALYGSDGAGSVEADDESDSTE